jgi:hypothetical protein
MGKQSKRVRQPGDPPSVAPSAARQAPAAAVQVPAPVYYPSDGPSDVELLQTTSQTLQAKLDQLTQLGLANDRAGFCQQFVPIDLGAVDVQGYLEDLTTHPEADGQWNNLVRASIVLKAIKFIKQYFILRIPYCKIAIEKCRLCVPRIRMENGEPKDKTKRRRQCSAMQCNQGRATTIARELQSILQGYCVIELQYSTTIAKCIIHPLAHQPARSENGME